MLPQFETVLLPTADIDVWTCQSVEAEEGGPDIVLPELELGVH